MSESDMNMTISPSSDSDQTILATTVVDAHGQSMSKQALEGMAAQIEDNPIRRLLEHDWTIPPDAKLVRAELVELRDEQFALYGTHDPFTVLETTNLPDGTPAIVTGSVSDRRPFEARFSASVDRVKIAVDRNNFDSEEDMRSLLAQLDTIAPLEDVEIGRKSLIPDPEMIAVISRAMIEDWWKIPLSVLGMRLGNRVVDRVGDDVGDDVARLYQLVRTAPIALLDRARPRGAEVTYVLVVSGTPEIQFIIRTRLPRVFERAIRAEELKGPMDRADSLHARFDATEIQFLYENDGWQFNFLLTSSGDVVGTRKALDRRAKRMQMDASRLGRT